MAVLAGYRLLEAPAFSAMLLPVGLLSVVTVASRRPALSRSLFLTQSLVAIASVLAIVLHVTAWVGFEERVLVTLRGFAWASVSATGTYISFAGYLLLRAAGALLVFWLSCRWLRSPSGLDRFLAVFYGFSAVNIACEYSIRQPLLRVGADPEAVGFLYAAGIFGLEFSLPLHVIALVMAGAGYRRAGRMDEASLTSPAEEAAG